MSAMAPLMRQSLQLKGSKQAAKQGAAPSQMQLTSAGVQFLNYITGEVQKFLLTKRLSEQNIRELD